MACHVPPLKRARLPQNGVRLELLNTAASQNFLSCQFADKLAEKGFYDESDVILLNNCFSW